MRLSDFDYDLPPELIAQYPLRERDQAKLLILDRNNERIEHRFFRDIIEYLKPEELLVLNNTKVRRCRLLGQRSTGGKVDILLLRRKDSRTFQALMKPSRLRLREKIFFHNDNGQSITGEISGKNEIVFSDSDAESVYDRGVIPLPPYIKRFPDEEDAKFYQTVYAAEEGSIASPTAGLHFTEELLSSIRAKNTAVASVTLHVGYGTFKPVKTDDIADHVMEKEQFFIDDRNWALVQKAREEKKRIIAVGTTSCRVLETAASGSRAGETNLFIYPGYRFTMVDALITNFHLPKTTLFILACAFAGEKLLRKAYAEAIERKYRFYSYGDAMMII